MIVVCKEDRDEVLSLTEQINRLDYCRRHFIAYMARKHEIDLAQYNYSVDEGRFTVKEVPSGE
jgi:hypothetical protein